MKLRESRPPVCSVGVRVGGLATKPAGAWSCLDIYGNLAAPEARTTQNAQQIWVRPTYHTHMFFFILFGVWVLVLLAVFLTA